MVNPLVAQSAAKGALPSLYAATAPEVASGDYFGPNGFMEMWGAPVKVGCSNRAKDADAQRKLWTLSEQQTGVSYLD